MESAVYNIKTCGFAKWFAENNEPHAIVIKGELDFDNLSHFIHEFRHCLGSPVVDVEFSDFSIAADPEESDFHIEWVLDVEFEIAKDELLLMALRIFSNLDSCKHFVIQDGMVLSYTGESLFHFPPVNDVVIPQGIEYIGHNAFNMRERMTSVTLNDRLRRIGNKTFDSCDELKEVILPDSVEDVGEYAFYASGVSKVRLSEGMSKIPLGCFRCCYIEELYIPHSIKVIEEDSLYASIMGHVVVIPEGVEEIQSAAFYCIESIYLPSTLKKIAKDFFFERGFEVKTPKIEVHPDNPVFYSEKGMLYYRKNHKQAVHKI